MSKKNEKQKTNPLICPMSGKQILDLNFSERANRNFPCGECGARLPLEKDLAEVITPQHDIPEATRAYRKTLRQRDEA